MAPRMRWLAAKDPALDEVRSTLRTYQREPYSMQPAADRPLTREALREHRTLCQTTPGPRPGTVRRGAFVYDADTERRRCDRGKRIIQRVQPGPFEDPGYFAMLSAQAASVELAAEDLWGADLVQRFVLGTVHSSVVNAFAKRVDLRGHTMVMLNSGLIDFIYQASKAVVYAVNPAEAEEGSPGLVQNTADLKRVARFLDQDDWAVERVHQTLAAHFFEGKSRAYAGESVPLVQHPALGMTISFAERFVTAHEYGHGLIPPELSPGDEIEDLQREELTADSLATVLSVHSASAWDSVPPEFPLSAAIFALSCLDLRERAERLLSHGDEHFESREPSTHPPFSRRAAGVIHAFRTYFDVDYEGDRIVSCSFVTRRQAPPDHPFQGARADRVRFQSQVLEEVWKRAKPRLVADLDRGRQLHSSWR